MGHQPPRHLTERAESCRADSSPSTLLSSCKANSTLTRHENKFFNSFYAHAGARGTQTQNSRAN